MNCNSIEFTNTITDQVNPSQQPATIMFFTHIFKGKPMTVSRKGSLLILQLLFSTLSSSWFSSIPFTIQELQIFIHIHFESVVDFLLDLANLLQETLCFVVVRCYHEIVLIIELPCAGGVRLCYGLTMELDGRTVQSIYLNSNRKTIVVGDISASWLHRQTLEFIFCVHCN